MAEWRGQQRAFYDRCRDEIAMLLGEPGWRLTEEEPMIICSIRLVADDDDDAGGSPGTSRIEQMTMGSSSSAASRVAEQRGHLGRQAA